MREAACASIPAMARTAASAAIPVLTNLMTLLPVA